MKYDRQTKYEIHDRAVLGFAKKLELAGLARVSTSDLTVVPPWSFSLAPRRKIDSVNGLFPRDIVIKFGPQSSAASLKIYGSDAGELTSATYRAVGYMALSKGQYLQVLCGVSAGQIAKHLHWRPMFQEPVVDLDDAGGIRSEAELLEAIINGRAPR